LVNATQSMDGSTRTRARAFVTLATQREGGRAEEFLVCGVAFRVLLVSEYQFGIEVLNICAIHSQIPVTDRSRHQLRVLAVVH